MGDRSLRIQAQYIKKANNALTSLGLTKKEFAETRLQLSRSTVSNCLNGKPVSKENFVRICGVLKLDWSEMAGLKVSHDNIQLTESTEEIDQQVPINRDIQIDSGNVNETIHGNYYHIAGDYYNQPAKPTVNSEEVLPKDIISLVNQLREKVKADIETRCGTMRILDMSQPIGLNDIYTKVNILEKISGRRRKDITELTKNCDSENFNRFNFGQVKEKIPGKTAVSKDRTLLILGKPGAGKTTFLKHLAIQCSRGIFQGELVPFFIILKEFAETEEQPKLLDYLSKYISGKDRDNLDLILNQGKTLICLDGLDEVLAADSKRVIKQIESLVRKYPNNQYLMTCRIAAKEYTFTQFTEVEIADFNWEQISIFVANWFNNTTIKSQLFLDSLEQEKNINDLTTNPFLLTLLCLWFEEYQNFPKNRHELLKEVLKLLFSKWDVQQGVQRDEIYQKLWTQRKENLLSKLAWSTFSQGEYFFKQDKAERYIGEYIRNLPGANTDEEALRLDSEAVLKSIESQHGLLVERAKGIYSFSHLIFQEYFAAREIIIVRQSSDEALGKLVSHLFDQRWREVFLLAVAMSSNAEKLILLIKSAIDISLKYESKMQTLLSFLDKKANSVNIKLDKSKTRFFYLDLLYTEQSYLNYFTPKKEKFLLKFDDYLKNDILEIDFCLSNGLSSANYIVDSSLNKHLYPYPSVYWHDLAFISAYETVDHYIELAIDRSDKYPNLKKDIVYLYKQLPRLSETGHLSDIHPLWWENDGLYWITELRKIYIKHRNFGYEWNLNQKQKSLLQKYYMANLLLFICLHQDCYISPEVRQEIEVTMLLPIAEIEKRKNQ